MGCDICPISNSRIIPCWTLFSYWKCWHKNEHEKKVFAWEKKKKVENIDNLIKSCGGLCFLTSFSAPPVLPHTSTTHTHSPHCVHTSGFPIPATKPHQQGGNDPATTVVMIESVGGLTCSLALPNKSPNSSVYISADPANSLNAPIRRLSPHASFHLSLRCEKSCWHTAGSRSCLCTFRTSLKIEVLAPRAESVDKQWIRRQLV